MRDAGGVGSGCGPGRTMRRALTCAVGVCAAALVLLGAQPASAAAALPAAACSRGAAHAGSGSPLFTSETVPADPFVAKEQVPDQWLAKLFTEGLGCAPDQASYAAYDRFVQAQGCSLSTLQAIGIGFLTSREFLRLPYGYAERLLVLWRIARESEPDPQQYTQLLSDLSSGRTRWADAVRSFFDAAGFGPAVPRLCPGATYGMNPGAPVIDPPTSHTGAFGDGTGTELQQRLDRARPGDRVLLEQRAVVRVGGQLVIPRGVTLETAGAPAPSRYASMARLVRTA